METSGQPPMGTTEQQIERELELVRGAIAMVAGHGARRVTVAGIRFGEELLPEAGRLAQRADIRVRALWHIDDTGCDITVEGPEAA